MSDGCEVDLLTNTFLVTKCKCNHLTAFGSFYVAPNILPTPSLALIKAGYTLLVVVASILFIWIVGLLFARRIDRNDIKKVGVSPLIDNYDKDYYLYQIIVNTGSRINAGTKSNIFFKIVGDLGDSGNRQLKGSQRICFQRSSVDAFIMTTNGCLGDLSYIQLWHDNSGGGWHLRDIEIIDLQTEKLFYFIANCWITIDHGDTSLDLVLPVSVHENITSFNYLFLSNAREGFTDEHLWLSLVTRLPISNFTRCQRVSVAICLLMTSMTASAMFFQRVQPSSPAAENRIRLFVFTIKQLYVGITCAFITFPVNILLTYLFRLVHPIYKQIVCIQCREFENIEDGFSVNEISQVKKLLYFPYWFLYISWIICITTILALGYVIMLYGMSFGNKKSMDWLASISLGLINDILLIQPLKIFIFSAIAALSCKAKVKKERLILRMQGKMLAYDENWLHSKTSENPIPKQTDVNRVLPSASLLKSMKTARLTELKMHSIIWELLLYILFSIVVFYLGYISRESCAYYQTRDVEELFNLKLRPSTTVDKFKVFKRLQSSDDFWSWMDSFFLTLIYPEPWFNLSDRHIENMNLPGKIFLPDLTSKIVNGIRIRQVRVKTESCLIPDEISAFVKIPCLSKYYIKVKEVQDFNFNWQKPKTYNSPVNSLTKPWRYQTSEELDGHPISATLEIYGGGGYVIEIFPKWKNKDSIKQLKKRKWVDPQTRALIVEFALFNAATNCFTMVTIVFEFPSFGGMVPYYDITTFNLYTLTTKNSITVIGSQIIFLLLMLVFTVRECKILYRQGWSYFFEFWNIIEVSIVVLSALSVVFFFYKVQLLQNLLYRLHEKNPQTFINFQFASYWMLIYTYIVSMMVFIASLKFIKLLRFNRRISLLISTLKVASFPLCMLGIAFLLVFCAIISFSTIIFGTLVDGYQTYIQVITSLISFLLGKFSFYNFIKVSPALGLLFFMVLNVFMVWIFMIVAVLNNTITSVRLNKSFQNNDYEMVDYFLIRLKGWFGLNSKNDFKNFRPSEIHCSQIKSEKLGKCLSASSVGGVLHLSKNYSMNCFFCDISYDKNAIEHEDDEYMSSLRDKFINSLHILYNRTFAEEKT